MEAENDLEIPAACGAVRDIGVAVHPQGGCPPQGRLMRIMLVAQRFPPIIGGEETQPRSSSAG
jgi:hypothetical protein